VSKLVVRATELTKGRSFMSSIGQEARWKHEILTKIKKARKKGDKRAVKRMAGYYRIGSVKVIYDWKKR